VERGHDLVEEVFCSPISAGAGRWVVVSAVVRELEKEQARVERNEDGEGGIGFMFTYVTLLLDDIIVNRWHAPKRNKSNHHTSLSSDAHAASSLSQK